MEFERSLKQGIAARAITPAPASLRARLLSDFPAPEDPPSETTATPAGFRLPRRRRALLASAALLCVAGGVALYLSPITHSLLGPRGFADPAYRTTLAAFVGSQHDECELHADMISSRFRTTDLKEVPGEFKKILGQSPDLGSLSESGFTLLGAGSCAVPGRGRSARLVLLAPHTPDGAPGRMVSVHIQQDTGELRLSEGKTYRLSERGVGTVRPASEIFVWRRDGFIYFLTAKSDELMNQAREALGAPPASGTL